MTQITSLHDIEKTIGNMLVKQSALDRSRIMNLITPRGVDLSKFITEKVKLSYDLDDVVIIFEVTAEESSNINLTEIDGDDIREDSCFRINLVIYGNEALAMAKILKARIESEKVRSDLLNAGMFLVDVGSISSMNEFMNETMWPRADLSLKIACEMTVQQIDQMPEIEKGKIDEVDTVDD